MLPRIRQPDLASVPRAYVDGLVSTTTSTLKDYTAAYISAAKIPYSNISNAPLFWNTKTSMITIDNQLDAKDLIIAGTVNDSHISSVDFSKLINVPNEFPVDTSAIMVNSNLDYGNSYFITSSAKVTSDTQLVNKQYVDNRLPVGTQVNDQTGDLIIGGTLPNCRIKNVKDPIDNNDVTNMSFCNNNYMSLIGGTLKGALNMGGKQLTGLTDPISLTDSVNFGYMDRNYFKVSGGQITGNINMNGNMITGLKPPVDGTDAVCLDYLRQNLASYLPLNSTTITVGKLTGLGNPGGPADAVNLSFLQNILATYIQKTGDKMLGDLDMNSKRLLGLLDPVNGSDPVTLSYMLTYVDSSVKNSVASINTTPTDVVTFKQLTSVLTNHVKQSGGSLTGSLNMNNNSITRLKDPIDQTDAVNLNYLHSTLLNFVSLTGGKLLGNFDMNLNRIIGLPDPSGTDEPVTLNYLKTALNNYLPVSNINAGLLSGTFSDPIKATDAVTLKFLNACLTNFLKLSGGSITGTLNLNGNTLTGVKSPSFASDAVNLGYLSNYLTVQGGNVLGELKMNGFAISGLPDPLNQGEPVTLGFLNNCLASCLGTSGGALAGGLNMNGNKITGVGIPVNSNDAVTLSYLNQALSTTITADKIKAVVNSAVVGPFGNSNSSFNIILGDSGRTDAVLQVNGKITGLQNPNGNTDAVNLGYLGQILSGLLSTNGGKMYGSLDMSSKKLYNLPPPVNASDPVTLGFLTNTFMSTITFDALSSALQTNSVGPIGNAGNALTLTLGHSMRTDAKVSVNGRLSNVNDPVDLTDVVNKNYLQNNLQQYLPLSGGSIVGAIDVGGNTIHNASPPTMDLDVANKQYVDKASLQAAKTNDWSKACVNTTGFVVGSNKLLGNSVISKSGYVKDPIKSKDKNYYQRFIGLNVTSYTSLYDKEQKIYVGVDPDQCFNAFNQNLNQIKKTIAKSNTSDSYNYYCTNHTCFFNDSTQPPCEICVQQNIKTVDMGSLAAYNVLAHQDFYNNYHLPLLNRVAKLEQLVSIFLANEPTNNSPTNNSPRTNSGTTPN